MTADGPHTHAQDPAIAAEVSRATSAEAALAARIAKLEAGTTVPPVTPPSGTAPSWWVAPVTSRTVQIPASIDATGTTDVTAALLAFNASVPDGSIITGAPTAIYKFGGNIIPNSRNNLIFDMQGGTWNNIANPLGTSGWTPYADSAIFWTYGVKPYPTHLTFRNIVLKAANPTPGKLQAGAGEYAAFLHSMGGQYLEVTNVTASGLFGDLITLNENSQFVWSHGNHMIDCGRNSVSVVAGSHIVIEDSAHDVAGYCSFDIEPESGSIAGSANIVYRRNTHKTWGNCFFAMDGSNSGKLITDVTVDSNTVSGSSLLSVIGNTGSQAQRIAFTNNAGKGTANVTVKNVSGLVFKGNTGATLVQS